MNVMNSALLSTVAGVALAGAVAASTASTGERPEGMILLTVAGDVDNPTRGPVSDEPRSILATLDVDFDQAVEFDADGLAAFDQVAYDRSYLGGDFAGTFSGPQLSDVLEAVGLPGAGISAVALDRYEIDVPAEMIGTYAPILATHLNGRPLELGGYGPIMLVFPAVDEPQAASEIRGMQAWATIYIEAV